jgi:cyclophilin family peptidyl-prolyl cis-trans isomerase
MHFHLPRSLRAAVRTTQRIAFAGAVFGLTSLVSSLCSAAELPGPLPEAVFPGNALPENAMLAAPALATISVQLDGRNVSAEVENPANPLLVMETTRGDLLLELLPAEAPETVANFLALADGTKPFIDPYTGMEELRPFYEGLTFHRVVDGFVIQAGSPDGTPNGGPGYAFADEINANSLGLDQMQVLDPEGYPNPVLGIASPEDFQQRVLEPLYARMGITNKAALEARVGEVEDRLRTLTVKQANEMLGYRYIETVQSRAPLRGVIAMANSGPDSNGSQFFITLADAPWLTGKHTVFGKVRAGLDVVDAIGKVRVDAEGRPQQDVTILALRRIDVPGVAPTASAPVQFE